MQYAPYESKARSSSLSIRSVPPIAPSRTERHADRPLPFGGARFMFMYSAMGLHATGFLAFNLLAEDLHGARAHVERANAIERLLVDH